MPVFSSFLLSGILFIQGMAIVGFREGDSTVIVCTSSLLVRIDRLSVVQTRYIREDCQKGASPH